MHRGSNPSLQRFLVNPTSPEGAEARHSRAPMDWHPGLQVLPLRAFLSLGRQLLRAALMGDPGGDAPPGRPCHGASWTQCPHRCCGFQPGVGIAAARDILSLGAGYSCWAMGREREGMRASAFESHHSQTDRCRHGWMFSPLFSSHTHAGPPAPLRASHWHSRRGHGQRSLGKSNPGRG